jgi:hypothetical protein
MNIFYLLLGAGMGEKPHIAINESNGKQQLHIDINFITYSPLTDCWLTHHLS